MIASFRYVLRPLAWALLVACASGCASNADEAETSSAVKELAHRYFEEVLNQGNVTGVDQMLSADFALYVPPSLSADPVVQGLEGFKQLVAGLRSTFPDLRFIIHEEVAEGEIAMVSWTMQGTQRGEWLGVPATGRAIAMTGVDVFKVVDGRIAEVRIHADYLGVLRQLGALPQ